MTHEIRTGDAPKVVKEGYANLYPDGSIGSIVQSKETAWVSRCRVKGKVEIIRVQVIRVDP